LTAHSEKGQKRSKALSTWATERLSHLVSGATPPALIAKPDLLNGDGTMFGGYLAALAEQMLAFAAMTVLPGDN
jgi:acyl-coenzyme A thioesterase PaaI-like protein